jgi:hypothetical protein
MLDGGWRRAGLVAMVAVTLALALVAPASAVAPTEKAVAKTGGAANIAQTTVVLNGSVHPNRRETTYFFQYGTTSLYGAQTPAASAGRGKRVKVAVGVTGLAPATRYHYRLVAQNAKGVTRGEDRVFTTTRQPLGITLAATPNPIRSGRPTTLWGALTGTGNAGRQVALQANPFPYTQGFVTVGNAQVTNAMGGFAFPIMSVPVNTQYRVLMPSRPEVASPIVVVGSKVRVTTRARARGGRLRLFGRISPAAPGSEIQVQRRRRGRWVTVGRTFARAATGRFSRYAKRVRARRGRYRVFANVQGAHTGDTGRVVRVRR